jgi:thiosulfate reductase cytochrome b subunit
MATYARTLRRGLPRRPGGEPWPPVGAAPLAAESAIDATESVPDSRDNGLVAGATDAGAAVSGAAVVAPVVLPAEVTEETASGHPIADAAAPSTVPPGQPASPAARGGARQIRRGLPRTPGGEPWPPAGSAPAAAAAAVSEAPAPAVSGPAAVPAAAVSSTIAAVAEAAIEPSPEPSASLTGGLVTSDAAASASDARPLRRGLPRTAVGDPWPPAGFAPAPAAMSVPAAAEVADHVATAAEIRPDVTPPPAGSAAPPAEVAVAAASEPPTRHEPTPSRPTPSPSQPATDLSVALPYTRTVFPGAAARAFERQRLSGTRAQAPEPARIGPFTKVQWAGAVIVGGAGLLIAAAMTVLAVRFLLSLEPMQEFLATYPGEYHLPEGAPVGIPPWLGWQHFFNVFLMVLIIRTGLQVRTEKRPSMFWSPRNNNRRKISLNLWFHQSLDLLWVINGVIFVTLLFVTGQWMKIVPTSWEVFPNAISAALQYISLDWPTENGWVNYNSLQQLAYFTTVFLAAPLAIITGVRMSGIWPKNATALNKAYPVEWARKVHFPVMLYFVLFIIAHVTLVLATGALRNLNHMYASQDAVNWTGFWIFVASLVVIAAGWVAARPLVLAPIARLFGKVSGR